MSTQKDIPVYNKSAKEEGIQYIVPYILAETEKGIAFPAYGEEVWLPKSQVHIEVNRGIVTLWVREWLVTKDSQRLESIYIMAVLNRNPKIKENGPMYQSIGVEAETDKAYGFPLTDGRVVWIPKSQCHVFQEDSVWFYIPKWLEEEKKSKLDLLLIK